MTRAADGSIQAQTTINWDTEKYDNYYYPSIWKTQKTKKFIGLDHQVALGSNGISLSEFYANYANTKGSNLDGGTVGDIVARYHRVLDVLVEIVELEVGDGGDATLGEGGVGLVEGGLTDHTNLTLVGA